MIMDTDIQFDDTSSVINVPSTPQPHHANLPSNSNIPPALSPTTSMIVANPSSPPLSFGSASLPTTQGFERAKFSSPPPPSSSMTPPPSSQPAKRTKPDSPLERASTPTPSGFSSPPPTVPNGVKRESGTANLYNVPSPGQVADASAGELREMLQASIFEISRLEGSFREARMSAAHYKLQHNLLAIETEEAAKRMEVEHEMTRREVDVLQMAEIARRDTGSSIQSSTGRYITELRVYCEAMDRENAMLNQRLQRAKKLISQKDDDLVAVMDDNRRFVQRIRENREHLNRLKSPGGIYAATTPRTSAIGFPSTPQQYRGTPKHTPHSTLQEHDGNQDSAFAALLLADRVLNQENTSSAPSTPTTSRPFHRSQGRHNRGVQSLSSLPSTPLRSQPMTENGNLLPSVQFAPQSEPRYRAPYEFFNQPRERSRKSRDSTISASDADEIAAYNEADDEDIPESQASQSATAMLRRDPRESMEVVRTPTPTTAAEKSGLLQAKIFGSITKTGGEKRKHMDDSIEYEAKKLKTGTEGVGLGIGSWA